MKAKKITDERVQKSLEQDRAPMYSVLLILTTLSLIVKIALKLHPALYIIEIIALILSPSYYIISTAQKNILFVKETDEAITNIKKLSKIQQLFATLLGFYSWVANSGYLIHRLPLVFSRTWNFSSYNSFEYDHILIYGRHSTLNCEQKIKQKRTACCMEQRKIKNNCAKTIKTLVYSAGDLWRGSYCSKFFIGHYF